MAVELQKEIRTLLQKLVERGRISHAYLFAGPEGAGKSTLALEFAASLLCEQGRFPPCRECRSCRRVFSGSHPDVVRAEVEGRNIKIDEIRRLASRLRLQSYEGGWKIGLVFQAELMNEPAQNAFLKTLEEPSPGTVLILTCASLSRLLPTIISRCQVLRFPHLSEPELAALLEEERGLAPEHAELLAAVAQGNARKAMNADLDFYLEQRKELARKALALNPAALSELFNIAEDLAKADHGPEEIMDLLSFFYQDALRFRLGIREIKNKDLLPEVRALAEKKTEAELIADLEKIYNARERVAANVNPLINWELLTLALAGTPGAKVTRP